MSVVINIGGSVLAPSLDSNHFSRYAEVLKRISREKQVFVVTGGGLTAREYINTARNLTANEAVCDKIGIGVTRLNARLLISALGSNAYPEPPTTYIDAENANISDKIVVMGGVALGQSTDAVAAILAEYVDSELLVFATSVDGVFTSDPNENDDAEKLDKLSPKELVDIVMETETKAGSKAVVDPLASKIIERSEIPTIVMDGNDPKKLGLAVLKGKHNGTYIRKKES